MIRWRFIGLSFLLAGWLTGVIAVWMSDWIGIQATLICQGFGFGILLVSEGKNLLD